MIWRLSEKTRATPRKIHFQGVDRTYRNNGIIIKRDTNIYSKPNNYVIYVFGEMLNFYLIFVSLMFSLDTLKQTKKSTPT